MYVDDVLLFSKANPKSLEAIKSIFKEFSLYSSLELNTSKSKATFSKVCEDNGESHAILAFAIQSLPTTYLGLPITGKKKSFNQCRKLIPSIENLLPRWNGKCLS